VKFLGQKLKTLREAKNLSMTDLYRLTEIKQGYISEIENGKKQPSDKIVKKLCSALGIDELYFYYDNYKLLSELSPGDSAIKEYERNGDYTPYAVIDDRNPYADVNEKCTRYGISPEDVDQLIDLIIKNRK